MGGFAVKTRKKGKRKADHISLFGDVVSLQCFMLTVEGDGISPRIGAQVLQLNGAQGWRLQLICTVMAHGIQENASICISNTEASTV